MTNNNHNNAGIDWFDTLSARFGGNRSGLLNEPISGAKGRSRLVARVRWLLLLFIGSYVLSAGSVFLFSQYGFFLSAEQKIILIVSVLSVSAYNLVYQFLYDSIRKLPFIDHLQILLDMIFVTALIHVSGGVSSWFWAVYLVVTIEAAFLLEKKRDVWILGASGGILFGGMLASEYYGIMDNVMMPFVLEELHHDYLYIALRWLWVAILNVVTALVTTFLMGVIRTEALLLKESEERLLKFIDTANDLIICFTPEGRVIYANNSFKKVIELSVSDMAELEITNSISTSGLRTYNRAVGHALKRGFSETIETDLVSSEGKIIPVEGSFTSSFQNDRPVAVWWVCRDISERKMVQQQLYQLAHYDALTNLPNRVLLYDRLKQAKAYAHREGGAMAVIFLDLDRFKIINDTLGHPVGDKLLHSVAKRLSSCIREVDTAARIGGDEFVIILVNLRVPADAEKIAAKVLTALSSPHVIDDHELFITTSIGISLYPSDDEDVDNLIKKADIAMYASKSDGSNAYRFYAPTMDEHAHKRFVLENSLRKALDNNEFQLYYQPKVDIATGEVTAFEALLRWSHPDLGLLSPAEFIPLAEETGLIIPIGEWVIRHACSQTVEWQRGGLANLRMAVNLSGYQLQQKNFLDVVSNALSVSGLEPSCLELEITETVIMQNPDFTIAVLNNLRDMGIHISIDDFGTGYSSLSHLKRFSVNTLKIDKTFVNEVESSPTDAAIATAIIAMGSSLNLGVIAEGVETQGQLEFLKEKLCDEMQGYYYSRPMPPEKVAEFMSGKQIRIPIESK
jgi:diguanylate cyclase (GGDEF)-like protein/PAS domain S-box-containing protein